MMLLALLASLRWSDRSTLRWADFKGHAPRSTGEPSAVTDTGFRVQLACQEGILDIRVNAEFYPDSSWVIAARKSPESLRHEQGHFDITELYVRKMRKAIRDTHISCDSDRKAEAAGRKIFRQLDRQWEKAEKQYDIDTRDGTDLARQEGASASLATQLAELRPYRE